jgi:gliding motility-associated-like protein
VQVTDARGCQKNERFYINPGNCCEDVFAPNAFTPNSDGVNERWGIKTTAGMDIERFAIFNRWGQKVWQAYDQREEWDGKFAERDAESGTYYFMLYYTCLTDGKKYMRKGDILLIR